MKVIPDTDIPEIWWHLRNPLNLTTDEFIDYCIAIYEALEFWMPTPDEISDLAVEIADYSQQVPQLVDVLEEQGVELV